MATFEVKLKGRREVAEGTMAFQIEKPPGYDFKAGQFTNVALINPPETDDEGDDRTFSIASAPGEPDLMFATRMRNTAFKRVLKTLPLGFPITIGSPAGRMVLHDDAARPAVFLAGGIGITPFRSIIVQAAKEHLPHRLSLFYSNRRPEDAAFLDELKDFERVNRQYKLIGTMTALDRSNRAWHDETGYIDKAMLSRYLGDLNGPTYYIVGPPGLVDGMRAMLTQAGVAGDAIRIEKFAGY